MPCLQWPLPQVGLFIRKLHVEGGYGVEMQRILESAPKVTDLFLTLEIEHPDTTTGLCRSLTSINPTRVILHDVSQYNVPENKAVDKLVQKLCRCIKTWDNMVRGPKYLIQYTLFFINEL